MIGAPPSTGGGVQLSEMMEWVALATINVGGAGGTPLFLLTKKLKYYI